MKIQNVQLDWLGHAAFKLKAAGKTIYIDPYQLKKAESADILLITHSHYDHCSQPDIEKVAKDGTTVVCTPDSESKVTRLKQRVKIQPIQPGQEISFDSLKIKAFEAYNQNKKFHPKSEGWVGYVLETDKTVIYHAGDTDLIPEMKKLSSYAKKDKYFVALLPVGGTYTMNSDEAAQAAFVIKPNLAIPMHYASIVGSRADAERFVKLCKEKNIKAQILERTD